MRQQAQAAPTESGRKHGCLYAGALAGLLKVKPRPLSLWLHVGFDDVGLTGSHGRFNAVRFKGGGGGGGGLNLGLGG